MAVDISDWYWLVDSEPTVVFSSASVSFVPITDSTFLQWVADKKAADTMAELRSNADMFPTKLGAFYDLFNILKANDPAIAEAAFELFESRGELSADQIFNHKMAVGLPIVSTATPLLNGTYPIDTDSQSRYGAISAGILAGKGVPGGGSVFGFKDVSGTTHAFDGSDFVNLAQAVENYVYALYATQSILDAGGAASWPVTPVTIA